MKNESELISPSSLSRKPTSPDSPVSPSPHLPLSAFARWRNAILGTLLVLAGLAAAAVTLLARRSDDTTLATVGAALSLVIAALILILIVPPLARSARLEIASFDLPIEVTTGGAIFLAIVVVVGFAAWNTGHNLLFLIFSLLCSTLFVGWGAARTSLRDLKVSARFPDHIFAGEPAPVIVTLRNTKRLLPSLSVLVEARGPVAEFEKPKRQRRQRYAKRSLAYFTYIPHRAAAEQRVEQTFSKRGHVFIDGFELSTRFPFGFVRRRRRLGARNVDILVYPKPEPIGDELHLLPMNVGRMASARRGAGHDLFALRDYQPQDDLRHIDWKATARSRRLTVREFTSEDERRITIVLDTRPVLNSEEENFSERFEKGVIKAASHLKHFIDENAEVRLILGNETGAYGSGLEHLYGNLRRLANVGPDYTGSRSAKASTSEVEAFDDPDSGHDYAIFLTAATPGSIPAKIWRSSYVVYF